MVEWYNKFCDLLDIDPIILAKSIGIFVILAVLIMSMVIYPAIFVTLLIAAICIAMIGLIYSMIE